MIRRAVFAVAATFLGLLPAAAVCAQDEVPAAARPATRRVTRPARVAAPAIPTPPAAPAMSPEIRAALDSVPSARFAAVLRRLEGEARPGAGGEAALVLGQFLYARGEYSAAADAFARAAARLDPGRRDEARYWSGLCGLALRSPAAARAALEEVAPTSPRRPDALFAQALAWEMADRPERAMQQLEELLVLGPAAATPAALERLAALADGLNRPDVARDARARLVAEYPRSLEAVSTLAAAGAEPAPEEALGTFYVEAGSFRQEARARALAARATRSGFAAAEVILHGEGAAGIYSVRFGAYASAAEARQARDLAARSLGVAARVVGGR